MSVYKKKITYEFFAAGEDWIITRLESDYIEFEEKRKNGQEDCHIYGEAQDESEHGWKLSSHTLSQLKEYRSEKTAQDLIDFFNTHGVPSDDV